MFLNRREADLLEQMPHLSVFGLEPLDFLMDPLISLQLLQSGPLAVQVRTENKTGTFLEGCLPLTQESNKKTRLTSFCI